MGHTTYIKDPKQKFDQFELMKFYIDRAIRTRKPVYILTMSRENYLHPEKIAEKLKNIPGVHDALHVNGTIDCITTGTEKEAEELAKKLHVETGETIGCVKYDGQNMINFYVTLKNAISIARNQNKSWHLYDPKKDSLQALIKKARSGD